MPVACVSTALSFAELLPFWGSRHADVARKRPYMEDGHVVRTVFLDGEIASHTPGSVWCETGVKALDDALMGFCRAPDIEPFADPVLISAISALGTLLPRSRVDGTIVERQHVLTADVDDEVQPPEAGGWPRRWLVLDHRAPLTGRGARGAARHRIVRGAAPGDPVPRARHRRASGRLKRAVSWGDNVTYASLAEAVGALLARLHVPTHLSEIGVDGTQLDDVVAAMVDEAPWLGTPEQLRAACDEML